MWETLPINVRLYLQSLLGETKPITEKDFSKSELEVLKQQGNLKYVKGPKQARQNEQDKLRVNKQGYLPSTLARLYDQTYEKDYTPTSKQITYADYSPAPDLSNWSGTAYKTISDPRFRVATSLGNFGITDNGDHYQVFDDYAWNGDFNSPINSLNDLWNQTRFTRPTELLNGLAELFAPQTKRPVNIRINK